MSGKRPTVPFAPTITFSAARPCARRIALGAEGGTSIVSGTHKHFVYLHFHNVVPQYVHCLQLAAI